MLSVMLVTDQFVMSLMVIPHLHNVNSWVGLGLVEVVGSGIFFSGPGFVLFD